MALGPNPHYLHHRAALSLFVTSLNARDPLQGAHSQRVASLASKLAEGAGFPTSAVESVWAGALVHDIGKIGLPDNVLKNPGRLSPEEFTTMKEHPTIGRRMLAAVEGIPQTVLDVVHFHHERIDGHGYPEGLVGNQIPAAARLVAVADAWDAMTSGRLYRAPLSTDRAVRELVDHAGTQFDASLVEVFLNRVMPFLHDELDSVG